MAYLRAVDDLVPSGGDARDRIEQRLAFLYGADRAPDLRDRILARLDAANCSPHAPWSEQDVVLITYGDTLTRRGRRPLVALAEFLDQRLAEAVSTVHILPFFPFSSDDGFAVIDYRRVHPLLGDWEDIEAINQNFDLMFDFVLNHVSARSAWFSAFLACKGHGKDYFVEVDPEADVTGIVRPRVRPVLAGFETQEGKKFVWATFGEDQLDLDFTNPDLLYEMIDIFVDYLERGAHIVRLDAVAFLWKRLGTSCVHLAETHEVVKLLRDIAEMVAPGTLLLTETNVPHAENISYFGAGDEAHMIYQFALPPLLLHCLWRGSSASLTAWAAALEPVAKGCTYLNFTASHDGIGMRPVEGLLADDEIQHLIEGLRSSGAFVSTRDLGGGRKAVYEVNTTWFDALKACAQGSEHLQLARFLCSQLIVLALEGVPALYLHTLTATPNDIEAVDQTGHLRAVNRHTWELEVLDKLLDTPETIQHEAFHRLTDALKARRATGAFHPDAPQRILQLGDAVFAFERGEVDGASRERVLVLANVTDSVVTVANPLAAQGDAEPHRVPDLLSDIFVARRAGKIELGPYQVLWLDLNPG